MKANQKSVGKVKGPLTMLTATDTVENWRLKILAEENMEEHDTDGWLNLKFGNKHVEFPYRGFTPTVYEIYRSGYCAFLALALHEITHKPLAVFTITSPHQHTSWQGHVALKTGDDEYLDITGFSTAEEINTDYGYGLSEEYPAMELTIVHDWKEFKKIFHESIHRDPWGLFMGELEELVTRDYAKQLVSDYLS